jgi:PTH1 family peptidyl-tRNA hydrolase
VAGHNGLRSIVASAGAGDFYRFRLGISRPDHGNVTAWVLGNFSGDETIRLSGYLKKAAAIFEDHFTGNLETQSSKSKWVL